MPSKEAQEPQGKQRRKRTRNFTKRLKHGTSLHFRVNGAIVNAFFDDRGRIQVQVIGRNPRLISVDG